MSRPFHRKRSPSFSSFIEIMTDQTITFLMYTTAFLCFSDYELKEKKLFHGYPFIYLSQLCPVYTTSAEKKNTSILHTRVLNRHNFPCAFYKNVN